MLATSPVDGEYNFAGGVIDVSNNVGDERTQELLARPHGDAKRVPSGLKIICEPRKVGRAGWFRRPARRQTRSKFLDTAKSHFPGVFKLRGNQAIVRITGGVATLRERGVEGPAATPAPQCVDVR